MVRRDEDPHDEAGPSGPQPATPPAQRPWQHPSEVGHECRVHADRRRGRLLVTGVVTVGAGALVAAALLAHQHRSPVTPVAGGVGMDGSLARVELMDGGSTEPITGMVIDREGHVVVSDSLIAGASAVRVHCDGAYADAEVVASDPISNLAVLLVEAPVGAPPVLDDSPSLSEPLSLLSFDELGQRWSRQVVLDATTAQVVRANGSVAHDLLEASGASVDHGVLADGRGHLAGWVMASSGDRVMAYPPEQVMRLARDLIDDGHVPHTWIGVRAATADPAAGQVNGAAVLEVDPRGPAATVLRPGDVIVSVQGAPVASLGDLVGALDGLTPGTTISIGVHRDGGVSTVELATAEFPA